MTKDLALAARNTLAADPVIRALVGRSTKWPDGWIFSDDIYTTLENKSKCAIVITVSGGQTPNEHNTVRFPRMTVDVWADPTRNADLSVRVPDAKDKIQTIVEALKKHFHTVNLSDGNGMPRIWGTPVEVAARTGVVILGSSQSTEPDFSPIADAEGAWMGRVQYQVQVL